MTKDLFAAFTLFAFVSSITPGPNNLMLMASGANFGLWRSLPHMLGIATGFVIMVFLVGIGLMQVFDTFPIAHSILKILSTGYLLYLAWKIAHATPPTQGGEEGKPLTFLQAALFQWVNPKAWSMALTAITLYAPDRSLTAVLLVAALFGAVNLPCISSWSLLGQQMRHVLGTPIRLMIFNWSMAALLVASLYPVIFAN